MLKIIIPSTKVWNTKEEVFTSTKECILTLEHSLVSISKWEAMWHIPFISDDKKTNEQTISYIKCMTLTQNVKEEIYSLLTRKNLKEISNYIDDKMTATWFSKPRNKPNGPAKKEVVTSELIYYWMIALEIPFECQKWHLNRLLTLVKVCNAKSKSTDKSKVNKRKILQNNAELNAARRKKLNTSG